MRGTALLLCVIAASCGGLRPDDTAGCEIVARLANTPCDSGHPICYLCASSDDSPPSATLCTGPVVSEVSYPDLEWCCP